MSNLKLFVSCAFNIRDKLVTDEAEVQTHFVMHSCFVTCPIGHSSLEAERIRRFPSGQLVFMHKY